MHKTDSIWWLNPAATMLLLHLPMLVVSYLLPDWAYSMLWFAPKYFDGNAAALSVAMILCWLVGFLVLRRERFVVAQEAEELPDVFALRRLFRVCAALTLFGYAALLAVAVSRGLNLGLLWGALAGEKSVMPQLKDVYFVPVPGLTTFTQFGPAAAVLGTLLAKIEGWRSVRWWMALLLGLAALRALFISERLALLELVIPAGILLARFAPFGVNQVGRARRTLLLGLPVIAAVTVFILFAGSEYLRSWTNFYSQKGGDFFTFALSRGAGYYSTAYNNSAFLLYNFDLHSALPYFTAEWVWRFPGLSLLFSGAESVAERSQFYMSLLQSGVNPEFNNTGGLLLPVIDFGPVGGACYWFIAGLITRRLFDSFRALRLGGLLLFPIFMVGLLEASRLLYWTSGRIFPTFVMLGFVVLFLRRRPVRTFFAPMAQPIVIENAAGMRG